jgi:uncharacterized membrane protein
MEMFKKSVSKRLTALLSLGVLSCLIIVSTALYVGSAKLGKNDFISGFQTGIFVALMGSILFKINELRNALKNNHSLKTLYIKENDEREKMVRQQIASNSFTIIMIAIALATVISGFYSILVFSTLCITLGFIVLVKASLKLYYYKKY